MKIKLLIFDYFFCILICLFYFVPFLISIILISISEKKVFYITDRVGKNGKLFRIYKLRTMKDSNNKIKITSMNDKRVIKFGYLIRFMKIDEVPQIINVLKREMSIVGPRPEDPNIFQQYKYLFSEKLIKLNPGLTSPGTIYFIKNQKKYLNQYSNRNINIYVEKLLPFKNKLDEDIRQTSIKYSLVIILKTILSVIK